MISGLTTLCRITVGYPWQRLMLTLWSYWLPVVLCLDLWLLRFPLLHMCFHWWCHCWCAHITEISFITQTWHCKTTEKKKLTSIWYLIQNYVYLIFCMHFFKRLILQFPIWPEKPNKYLEKTSYILKLKILLEDWTESSASKSTCCFYSGPVIAFHYPHGSSRSSVTPKSAHRALNMHMAHIQRKAHTREAKIHEKIKSPFHSKIKLSYAVLWS